MSLQRSFRAFALVAGMLWAPLAAGTDNIPSILWSRHDPTKAAWVSLERATLPNGQIDWNLFGDLQSAVLKRRVEGHKGAGCVPIGSLQKERMDSRVAHDLKGLTQSSRGIYRGTVVASAIGFADGDPATLLAVQVDKTIKPSSEISTEDLLYVAYPVAELSVNGVRICKSDERLTAVPKAGDSILIFPLSSPLNEDRNLIYPFSQEVMVQRRDGALAIPGKWAKDSALGKVSNLREVETVVKAFDKPAAKEPRKEGL
jgi:hypothetical protein